MTASPRDTAMMFRRWIDDLWNGDTGLVHKLIADDFVGHWPEFDVHGPDDLVARVLQAHEMVAGMRVRIELGPIVDGDLVSGRWVGEGTMNGKLCRLFGNDILRVRDGRFVEYWVASGVTS